MAKSKEEVLQILEKYRNEKKIYDFSSCDFSGYDFSGWDFSEVDFTNANFSYANFSYANFSSADFSYADFSNANFNSADFSSADFSNADFRYVDFRDANFSNSNATVYTQLVNTTRSNNTIYYFPTLKIFSSGCFTGSEEELIERVNTTHKDNKHLHDRYMRVISNLKTEYEADLKMANELKKTDSPTSKNQS